MADEVAPPDEVTPADDLTPPNEVTPPDDLIVPALELAVLVARVLTQMRPPVPVPKRIRSLARFTKLPASARGTVRRVLDDDEEFRGRVAATTEQIEVPRASWLFLHRPEGWTAELETLAADAAEAEAGEDATRADRGLHRRLAGAEDRIVRLEEALLAAQAASAVADERLEVERKSRRDVEARLTELGRKLTAAETERARDRRRADEAEARAAERREPRGNDAEIEAERAARLDAEQRAAFLASDAERLRAALAAASAVLADVIDADASAGNRPAPPVDELAAPRARRVTRRTRRPAPLPPAVFDDSPEAAAHLVRVPGMLLLIDGYNVTLSTWGELPIAAQRSRLIDACAELAARSSAEVLIVFDGAEEPGDVPPAWRRAQVRWRFSPPGVEADDVLLGIVAELDAMRPVTVASSDRRVRDGARSLGANAISTPQLLGALRREPG